MPIYCAQVRCVYLSDDGELLASGDEERKAKVWDVEKALVIFSGTCGHTVLSVALSPEHSKLACGDAMGKLKVTSSGGARGGACSVCARHPHGAPPNLVRSGT